MLEILKQKLGGKVVAKKNILPYVTLRTKTTAQYYFEAESKDDLQKAYTAAKELDIPFFILGGGSNLAITKDFLPGLVVRNMYQKKEVVTETNDYVDLLLSSGYPMARVVVETAAAGWEGFEYHLGLPGTIGGAVYMNSKWTKPVSYVGDNLVSAVLLGTDGEFKTVEKDYFKFAYDYSYLQETKELVIEAVFRLKKNDPEVLKKRAKEAQAYRHQTQPHGIATAGCFFQNVNGESAGKMIDEAGLKGYQVGNFVVSDVHANFIVNKGEGDPKDLVQLIRTVKENVKEKFGVELKEEVLII